MLSACPVVSLSLCLFCAALQAGMSQEVVGHDTVSLLQTGFSAINRENGLVVNMTQLVTKTLLPQEVESMRQWSNDSRLLQFSCSRLADMINQKSSMQEVLVGAGAHELAIAAMRRFPDDWLLQVACSHFLSASVQWKMALAQIVGPAGAIDATIAAIRRHPEVPAVRGMLAHIGSQCDFVMSNRMLVNKLGGIELAMQIGAQYPLDPATQTFVQCFFSTQCLLPLGNHRKMLEGGYIPKSVRLMHDLPTSSASGEAIFIFNMCFSWDAANLASMADAGIIDALVNILHVGHGHFQDLDPIRQKSRIPVSAFRLFAKLAGSNATHRDALVRAGAIEAVQLAMQDLGASKESMPFGGLPWDGLLAACRALTELSAGSPANLAAVRSAGAAATAQTFLKERGPLDPARLACGPLLGH